MERTFPGHGHKSPLHGITVVVDTTGEEVWVGRCDDEDGERVVLLDADSHRDGEDGKSKADWLAGASRYGVWSRHPRVVIPRGRVAAIRPLAELA